MDQQATFRFHGGPSHSRTPRISKETWKKHEETIRALFPSNTLRELMDIMETQHGFKATEKQYIHQLPKWGLQKRVVKQGAPAGRSPSDASPKSYPSQPKDSSGREDGRDSPPSPFTTPGTLNHYALSPQYGLSQGTPASPFTTPGTLNQYTLSPPYGTTQETPASRLDLSPDAYTPRDYQPVVGGKRSRSIVSLASQVSGRSARDWNKRSKIWPESPATSHKAQGTTDFTPSPWASPHTHYDHGLNSPESHNGGFLDVDSPWSPRTVFTSHDPAETPATVVSDLPPSDDNNALLPGLAPSESGLGDWPTAKLHEALGAAARQVFARTLSDDPRVRVSKRHKLALRLSALAETLLGRSAAWSAAPQDPATTRVLRGVAEYLQAVGLWTDAFYLYALLLGAEEEEGQHHEDEARPPHPGSGRQKQASPPPAPQFGALHLACASTANTPAQCAMVRTWPSFAPAAAFDSYRRFLQHGAFADMYGRAELAAEAAVEAAEARRLAAGSLGATACVAGVRFGRNADLAAYGYFVRFTTTTAGAEATFAGYDRFVHRVWEAPVHGTSADGADGRDPLADLRSVLRWCFRAVDPTASDGAHAVFSTFSEIEAINTVAPAPDDDGPVRDPRALDLFHCLFDRWIQLRPEPDDGDDNDDKDEEAWLWTQAQERMGLAPTEFLVVLCEMITSASGGGDGVLPERSPVSYTVFIEQLDALDALPDSELADRFLAHFCAREAQSHRTGLPEPPPVCSSSAPASSTPAAAAAAEQQPTAPATQQQQQQQQPDDDVQSRSAQSAVAPSYASSEMSSFRRMARRARDLVRSPDVASHEPPSRLVRRPSLTVSELSESFSQSMSIGSSRPSLWGAPRPRQRHSWGWDEGRQRGG